MSKHENDLAVIAALAKYEALTARDVAGVAGLSDASTRSSLRRLAKSGSIRRETDSLGRVKWITLDPEVLQARRDREARRLDLQHRALRIAENEGLITPITTFKHREARERAEQGDGYYQEFTPRERFERARDRRVSYSHVKLTHAQFIALVERAG